MNKNVILRQAVSEDMDAVLGLVQELADYEKEPDAVTINSTYYRRCFEEGIFNVIVAEDGNKIVGMVLYYMTFSTWRGKMLYLEDFVVKSEYRNSGIGQKLWDAYIAEAKRADAKMVKWQVLDWNTPAIRFYEKNNSIIERNWWNGKIIF